MASSQNYTRWALQFSTTAQAGKAAKHILDLDAGKKEGKEAGGHQSSFLAPGTRPILDGKSVILVWQKPVKSHSITDFFYRGVRRPLFGPTGLHQPWHLEPAPSTAVPSAMANAAPMSPCAAIGTGKAGESP